MQTQNAVTLLTCCLGVISVSPAEAQPDKSPLTEALQFFDGVTHSHPSDYLRRLRPPPAPAADRARALADFPHESVLVPNAKERAKLAALESVLEYHERHDVFEIKVIDVPVAAIALHPGGAVLISRPALRLLSVPELQATVAHEIAHEYFWGDYVAMRARNDIVGLQTLELKCDGVAALTLLALGLEPAHMYAAAEKIARSNKVPEERWGLNGYPHPHDRERFVRALEKLVRREGRKTVKVASPARR